MKQSQAHVLKQVLSCYYSLDFPIGVIDDGKLSELHLLEQVKCLRELVLHAHCVRSLDHVRSQVQLFFLKSFGLEEKF